jgi:hypothetical protein
MQSIEDYFAKRKKEDNINEFDINHKIENLRICVNYVFEYFNNYVNITELEEQTILNDEKLCKYIKEQLMDYSPNIREWLKSIYIDCGKQANRIISNMLKRYQLFYLFYEDYEFREVTYELYSEIIKKLPTLKGQYENIFLFIKDYHRMKSESFRYEDVDFSKKLIDWINETSTKYYVNIALFAYEWDHNFWRNNEKWPKSHKIRNKNPELYNTSGQLIVSLYNYNFKQKGNLFNLDQMYKLIGKKPFIKGKKQELEILLMYYWIYTIEGDETGYWQEYLDKVLPVL